MLSLRTPADHLRHGAGKTAAMQLVPVNSNLVQARTATPERPSAVRGVVRVNELLSHTRTHGSDEPVLQGELLEGRAEPERPSARGRRVYDSRREDHPAFYQRHTNQEYVQRRALAAYQVYSKLDAGTAPGHGVDYFV